MKKQLVFVAAGSFLFSCKPTDKTVVTPTEKTSVQQTTTPINGALKSIDLAYMDKTMKPQDDFFQFSNGTWCKENPVPNAESRWGSFNELDKANKENLLMILTKFAKTPAAKGAQEQLLGDYFKSFKDMETRNAKGYGAIKSKMAAVQAIRSKEEIARLTANQHKVGVRSLFGFGVGQDMKNVERNTVYIGPSGLGLPNRDYYFQDNKKDICEKYVHFITRSFMMTGLSEEQARTKAKAIFEFEKQLAEKMLAPDQARLPEKTYNKFSYADAKKLFPKFDFETYLITLGSQTFDTIIVSQPDYLKQVNTLMESTPMDTWTSYFEWKNLNHYAGALDDAFVKTNFQFYGQVLSGKKEMKPIEERAIEEITNNTLGELLGKAFVEKYFSLEAKNRVNTMVDNLLKSFQDRIKGLDWMSEATKKEALTKLNAIGRKLVCPDEWRDFSNLTISSDDYIANLDNISLFETKEELGKLYKPVNKKEWGMPAHMVNAYYHPLLNEIAFPAGIMQPPFFDVNAEDAVNYGRIGMVIGHEFTHGFDDNGSKFAANGSYTNWWQESDRKLFEERTKTLGQTFEAFCPIDGHCVNPDLTMGENIADLGGLTMAFYAYKMTDEFKKGEIINGFTPAQRFFIAYAQLWKINYTEAELKNRIANDSHSPGMYRVNGPLMNCPEFFEAFGVKEGDKMRNKKEKVAKIW
ncbi:MAG: M13 family metallopeptidase [Fluviicola sp.]|nr:M13 family metallopeptidase [Fluviicola sp.]MBP6271971.1 M13 family metallopeptidase [Fluviicola sp.]